MRSEAHKPDPAGLELADLIAMRPRVVRGALPPGARIPGGARVGLRRAQGSDFDGIGPYQPGDDIRRIAWGASARSGKMQTKQFVADAHRARMIVLDDRQAFVFGTRSRPMAKTAALAAAFLIWEAVTLQEAVGLAILSEPEISAPRRGSGFAMTLLDRLALTYQRQCAGQTGNDASALGERLSSAASVLRQGDEICAISDFSNLGDGFAQMSRNLEPMRDLRAWILEDPVVHTGLPRGHYPTEAPGSEDFRDLSIRSDAATQRSTTERLLSERDRTLAQQGWTTFEAQSCLFAAGKGLT